MGHGDTVWIYSIAMAHHKDHPSTFSEHRMLLDDAKVLLDRYRLRNDPARRPTSAARGRSRSPT